MSIKYSARLGGAPNSKMGPSARPAAAAQQTLGEQYYCHHDYG